MSAGNSQWQYIDPFGVDVGMATRGGVRTPEAQYPDGYLTPMSWRHGRGSADVAAPPINARDSYDRGVNKFTKLPPEDYYWASDFDMSTRLRERVTVEDGLPRVQRMAYYGTPAERITSRTGANPGWMGSELAVHTDRPPWSPRV